MKERNDNLSEGEIRCLLSSPPSGKLTDSLRLVIRSFRYDRWLPIHEVADLAGMSLRSFQRELAADGVAFRELVDEVRGELAAEMLKDTKHDVEAIASALGYSNKANFVRAFQRWSGSTPDAFRITLSE